MLSRTAARRLHRATIQPKCSTTSSSSLLRLLRLLPRRAAAAGFSRAAWRRCAVASSVSRVANAAPSASSAAWSAAEEEGRCCWGRETVHTSESHLRSEGGSHTGATARHSPDEGNLPAWLARLWREFGQLGSSGMIGVRRRVRITKCAPGRDAQLGTWVMSMVTLIHFFVWYATAQYYVVLPNRI